jgi:hypothetical protein
MARTARRFSSSLAARRGRRDETKADDVERRRIHQFDAGRRLDPAREGGGVVVHAALDQRAIAGPTEGLERAPGGEPAEAARHFRDVREGIPAGAADDIGATGSEGLAQDGRVAHEGEAAVVGNVQPLVRVGGDRVGTLDAAGQVREPRRNGGEEAERPVDMQPGATGVGVAQVGERGEIVEMAAVHLAGVADEDHRAVDLAQQAGQRGDVDRPARSARPAHLIAAKAERAEALDGAEVDLGARDDDDRRLARQTIAGGVEAELPAGPLPRRDQADEIGHGGAAGQRAGPFAGRPKSSLSQRRTTSSVCAAAGLLAHSPAFWSIAEASQSPASAAGVTPPVTKPKKRGPGEAVMPRSARVNHSSTTPAGSLPFPAALRRAPPPFPPGAGTWLTGRSGSDARKAMASRVVRNICRGRSSSSSRCRA